ncbi:gamma-glutamyltransferase [bacterium]|nr:gamma-glutamyltransferase [bacterium]
MRSLPILLGGSLIGAFLGCAPGPLTKPMAEQPPPPPDTTFARAVAVEAPHGMVVSAHPLATQVGLEVLKSGGNAADAALATLAALNVVEPHASGLGGGGFLLYFDAAADSFSVLDYRERAPARIDVPKYFQPADTLRLVQRAGGTSVLTPGAPAGWQAMHARFGTRVLSDLFAPAISLADTGYPVSAKQSAMILDHLADLQVDTGMAAVFLQDSLPLMPGQRLIQKNLASTLRFLAQSRLENLYYPPLASQIVTTVREDGGTLSERDLMSYRALDRRPLRGEYHGYEIISLPPPASGGAALLEILDLVEPYDLKSMGFLSPDYIHTLALATRQSRADGNRWIADPEYTFVPVKKLLSDDWISEARTRMTPDSVPQLVVGMDSARAFAPGNTTHLVIVDGAGNLVSLTQSINYFFGAGLMVPELGLLLNNHMADFAEDTVSISKMAPVRRPPSNMAATIVRKDGQPVLVIGSPGGPRIAAVLAQVIIAVLDFGLPLDEALNAPRFFPVRDILVVETRIPQPTLDTLAARGWRIYPYGSVNNYFGGVHAIQIDSAPRTLRGAADPRRDGAPAGY